MLPWLVLLLATGAAEAEPEVRRAVLAGPVEAELLQRIRGQTSDLDWQLEVVDRAPGQDVLVWARGVRAEAMLVVERQPTAWDVSLVGSARERRMVRRVEVTAGEESSARETVAVIVRGLLTALGAGEAVVLEPAARGRWAPVTDAAPGVAAFAAVGAEGAWAGTALVGVRARAGVRLDAWTLALAVASGPARSLDDGRTTLSLARHLVMAQAGARLALGGHASVGGALGVGAVGFARSAVVRDPLLLATEPRLVPSFLASAEAQLVWWPTAGPVGVELSVGLDVAPGAPVLAYAIGSAVVERTEVAVVQPRVGLALVIDGGR